MTQHNFIIANGDTDSISFKKADEKPFTPEEQEQLLVELNALMPEFIVWKNDKHYRRLIVFAAKNYVMDDGKKVTIKGNSLKATKKEPALREFIQEVVNLLLKDKKDQVLFLYLEYVRKIINLKDIQPWCFKATITKKVLDPETAFNQKILKAVQNTPVSEGDKVHLFYKEDESLCLREKFTGEFNRKRLLGKLKASIKIFRNVMDVSLFPDMRLKRNGIHLAKMTIQRMSVAPPPPTPTGMVVRTNV
jgi:hypothetical protein